MCFHSIVAVVHLRHHNRRHLPLSPCQGRAAVNARQIKLHRSPHCWRGQAHQLDNVPYLARALNGVVIAPPQLALRFALGYRIDPSHVNIVAPGQIGEIGGRGWSAGGKRDRTPPGFLPEAVPVSAPVSARLWLQAQAPAQARGRGHGWLWPRQRPRSYEPSTSRTALIVGAKK